MTNKDKLRVGAYLIKQAKPRWAQVWDTLSHNAQNTIGRNTPESFRRQANGFVPEHIGLGQESAILSTPNPDVVRKVFDRGMGNINTRYNIMDENPDLFPRLYGMAHPRMTVDPKHFDRSTIGTKNIRHNGAHPGYFMERLDPVPDATRPRHLRTSLERSDARLRDLKRRRKFPPSHIFDMFKERGRLRKVRKREDAFINAYPPALKKETLDSYLATGHDPRVKVPTIRETFSNAIKDIREARPQAAKELEHRNDLARRLGDTEAEVARTAPHAENLLRRIEDIQLNDGSLTHRPNGGFEMTHPRYGHVTVGDYFLPGGQNVMARRGTGEFVISDPTITSSI